VPTGWPVRVRRAHPAVVIRFRFDDTSCRGSAES
jgi:hypothetical protein